MHPVGQQLFTSGIVLTDTLGGALYGSLDSMLDDTYTDKLNGTLVGMLNKDQNDMWYGGVLVLIPLWYTC